MLDTNQIPEDILHALTQRGHSQDDIKAMTPLKAFSEYCNWNGMSGWGSTLWSAVESLKDAHTP